MSSWAEMALGEIMRLGNGKARPNEEGMVPIYGGNGIMGYTNRYNYSQETVVIGRVGAYCGSVYYANTPVWVSDNALAASPLNGGSPKFLYYFLKHLNLNNYAEGSSHPLVTQSLLNSIEVNVNTDVRYQEQVAEVLSSLDDKIDLLHRQNKTLEQQAETLFRQWFEEEADESWPLTMLGLQANILRGLSYKGAGLSTSTDLQAVPMINLNSVYEGGGFKNSGTKYYNGEYKERHKIFPGDLIITNTEQGHEHKLIGYTAIVPKYIGKEGIFSQHIYRIVPNDKSISSVFLNYLLNYSSVRDQVIGATNGSTVNMLSSEGLQRVEFSLPPSILINNFTLFAQDIKAKQEHNFSHIWKLESVRNALLPKLMSGQVTVNE